MPYADEPQFQATRKALIPYHALRSWIKNNGFRRSRYFCGDPWENLPRLARSLPERQRGSVPNSSPVKQIQTKTRYIFVTTYASKVKAYRRGNSHDHRTPQNEKKHLVRGASSCGDPWENRTPVSALRGPCLSRLTNGPFVNRLIIVSYYFSVVNSFFEIFSTISFYYIGGNL